MTNTKARSDAYPDDTDYSEADQGCEYHPGKDGCKTCPFVVCRYDTGRGIHVRVLDRRVRIANLYFDQHVPARVIAERLHVNVRTVYRDAALVRQTR